MGQGYLNFTSYLVKGKKKEHRPLLNEIPLSVQNGSMFNGGIGMGSPYVQKLKFWRWFKTRLELNAPVMIRVDDTITDVDFYNTDGTPLHTEAKMEAEKFFFENQLSERLKSMQYDRLVTGDGFLWLGKPAKQPKERKNLYDDKIKEICKKHAISAFPEVDVKLREVDMRIREMTDTLYKEVMDEDANSKRIVDYIPSSTVLINYDLYEVLQYVQYYAGRQEIFDREEVIHIPLMRIDGKVNGYTPVESMIYELILLWAIKENMLAYVRNGGTPGKIFILPEEVSNSDNHKWLVQELMNRGVMENRHGNMVLTGKIEVQDLDVNPKDMEYEKLAKYVTNNIAYALRIPQSRLPYNLDGSAGSDAGGLAESGYWQMIQADQKTIEMHLNSQLFGKMGYHIKFKKNLTQETVRKSQAFAQWVSGLTAADSLLRKYGQKISVPKLLTMISGDDRNIAEEDLEKLTPEEQMMSTEKNGMLNKQFMKDSAMKAPGEQNKAETKKAGATNNPKGSNQTGY